MDYQTIWGGGTRSRKCLVGYTTINRLGWVWIGWEYSKDDDGSSWNVETLSYIMYVTVGRVRLCIILWLAIMPPIARGLICLVQPLTVSTVSNTGRNLPKSSYRGLEEQWTVYWLIDWLVELIDWIYSVKLQQYMASKQCRFNMRVKLLRITHESTPKYTYFQCVS